MPYGVLSLFFVLSTFISTNHDCKEVDHNSLLSSFDTSSRLNWSSSDCCHWEGIACDADGRVTHVSLPSKRIQGSVSGSLGSLAHLSHLNLSHNLLSGPLEAGLFLSSSRLEILDLSYNLLSGELPLFLSSSYIQIVDLSNNQFNATIPSSFLHHAWNLSSLNVSNNHFTSQIPSSICLRSSSLRVLDFSHNNFICPIPPELGNCSELEVFRAGDNTLSWSVLADIYNAQALQEISLSTNGLVGPISENVGKLSKLKLMRLHYNNLQDCISNNLTGALPISLYSCKSLKALRLSSNDFEGQIQPEILQLKNLTFLSLSHNRLTNVMGAMKILTGALQTTSISIAKAANETGHCSLELPVYFQRGPIPAGTQLQGFSVSAFERNPKLCSAPLSNQCFPSNGNDADENENNQNLDDDEDQSLWFGLSVVLGFFVGFLGFCCPLLLKRTWRYAYFQLLDNIQFMLYLKWRRLRRRKAQGQVQVQVPNQKDEVKSSKLDCETESSNRSEYANNSNSFIVPDNFQTTSLFNVPVNARCPEVEEILVCTD
ncbi:unnamed protein product [Malus baccata var. baccata]